MRPDDPCTKCGRTGSSYGMVDDKPYCHDDDRSCYTLACREQTAKVRTALITEMVEEHHWIDVDAMLAVAHQSDENASTGVSEGDTRRNGAEAPNESAETLGASE